jgi:hypothetical protein
MPRLDDDGEEELRALVAIRQTLEPLIAKRILDDSDKITSLAVSNSRDLFKFELDQIFLNLRKDQDLQTDDYASFLDDLRRLLQLLEGLVDEKVLRPSLDPDLVEHQVDIPALSQATSISPVAVGGRASLYPKLAALMKAASEEPDSPNLSKLLRLPEIEEECKEAEQTLTDFNVKNLSRSNTASRDNGGDISVDNNTRYKPLTKSKSRSRDHQLESVRQSQECLSSVLNALRDNIQDSKCPDCHIAKIQIRDPRKNSNNELQYKLFVACSNLQDKWQETTCTVVSDL